MSLGAVSAYGEWYVPGGREGAVEETSVRVFRLRSVKAVPALEVDRFER